MQNVHIGYDGLGAQTTSEHDTTSTVKTDQDYVLTAAATPIAASTGPGQLNTAVLADDGHGNISTITPGTNGSATQCAVRYDPYGTAISNTSVPLAPGATCNTGSTQSDQFYRSNRRDGMTGNYQLGARTYSPPTAGFLTPDTYQGPSDQPQPASGLDPLTRNTYTYVNGDPINGTDPNGHHVTCDPGYAEHQCEARATAASYAGAHPGTPVAERNNADLAPGSSHSIAFSKDVQTQQTEYKVDQRLYDAYLARFNADEAGIAAAKKTLDSAYTQDAEKACGGKGNQECIQRIINKNNGGVVESGCGVVAEHAYRLDEQGDFTGAYYYVLQNRQCVGVVPLPSEPTPNFSPAPSIVSLIYGCVLSGIAINRPVEDLLVYIGRNLPLFILKRSSPIAIGLSCVVGAASAPGTPSVGDPLRK